MKKHEFQSNYEKLQKLVPELLTGQEKYQFFYRYRGGNGRLKIILPYKENLLFYGDFLVKNRVATPLSRRIIEFDNVLKTARTKVSESFPRANEWYYEYTRNIFEESIDLASQSGDGLKYNLDDLVRSFSKYPKFFHKQNYDQYDATQLFLKGNLVDDNT